jgi:hypothetical protein
LTRETSRIVREGITRCTIRDMPIAVELRNESGGIRGRHPDMHVEASDLPAYDDARYPYLRLVDPYGDTVFSHHQMVAVLPEIEMLANERLSRRIDQLLDLARRCATEVHTYLLLIGD